MPDVKKYGDKEFFTKEELIEAFDLSGLSKSPAIFNTEKLDWFNHEYITRMSLDEYLELATPWFDKVLAGKNMDYRMLASLMHTRTGGLQPGARPDPLSGGAAGVRH